MSSSRGVGLYLTLLLALLCDASEGNVKRIFLGLRQNIAQTWSNVIGLLLHVSYVQDSWEGIYIPGAFTTVNKLNDVFINGMFRKAVFVCEYIFFPG